MIPVLFALLLTAPQEADRPLTRGSYRRAADATLPSVVTITVKGVADYSAASAQQKESPGGNGSGIIVDVAGLIVTNAHVVPEGPSDLTVLLSDGRRFKAEPVGRAKDTDIAVIRLVEAPENLMPAKFRPTGALAPGEVVIAVGSPLGLHNSVTHGVVSAVRPPGDGNPFPHFVVQTDASINPGNSGGALADLDGNIIGMNTFIRSAAGGSIGLGFAIPGDVVLTVVQQLAGKVSGGNGWIGMTAQNVREGERMAFGIPRGLACVLVTGVDPAGPAATAGLKQGDCIVAADAQTVSQASRLLWSIRNRPGGSAVTLEVRGAGGAVRHVTVIVAEKPQ